VLTFASGPTNSMRGAAYLSGLKNALVADIGGTTTDIGVLTKGFPRESANAVDIGGVRTNFRMPDVLSVGLGGGSLVRRCGDSTEVGPASAGYAHFGDRQRVAHLSSGTVQSAVDRIHRILADGVDRMKVSADPIPLVLVGGGSVLINRPIPGVSEVIVPEHAGVANAIGASIAQVSGESDQIVSYGATPREGAIVAAKQEATAAAVRAGASAGTVEVVEVEEVPLAYMAGGAVRLRVKVAGSLDLAEKR
jgi:N-methylhydantoinase A/oxoprolinase/acetone carboxylase beta subunit